MGTTWSTWDTATRLRAKAAPIPAPVVSPEVSGTQSKPITAVALPENSAIAARRAVRASSTASSSST